MPCGPSANVRLLAGGGTFFKVDVDGFSLRQLSFDCVEEPDELLTPVVLNVAAAHRAVQDIKGCKQAGGAVAFVIVGQRARVPSSRGSPVASGRALKLALPVDGQDDGISRRRDVEPDDIVKFSAMALSFASLELRQPCGARPCPRQIFMTEEAAIPTALSIARAIQCFASCRGDTPARATTHARGAPSREQCRAVGSSPAAGRPHLRI
jgi:hypothetical protein